MWFVFDDVGDVYDCLNDLYDAVMLAEAIGGRIEMRMD